MKWDKKELDDFIVKTSGIKDYEKLTEELKSLTRFVVLLTLFQEAVKLITLHGQERH